MKQEKGLGSIMTILLLIVILVIVGVALYFIQKQYSKETVETAKTEMLAVQGKVKMVARENVMDKEGHPLLGELLEGQEETDWVKSLLEEKVIPETKGMYKVTQKELGILQLDTISLQEGEYFLVNYEKEEVYFYERQPNASYKWYQLTQLLEADKTEGNKTEENVPEEPIEEQETNEEESNGEEE